MIYFCFFFDYFPNRVYLLLQPRRFTYKKKQKNRQFLKFRNNSSLNFGNTGLLTLRPLQLTAHRLFRFRLLLKKAAKKVDRTRRYAWIHAFPHLPLTKKPDGLRMGKGKGKLECWFTAIPGGIVLFEFKNLRIGRARFFCKQLTHKLGVGTKFLINATPHLPFPLRSSKKIRLKAFW